MEMDRTKDIPAFTSFEESARMFVINTINLAKERIGIRQDLEALANTATYAWADTRLSLTSIETPIPITAEKFLIKTIEEYWQLTKVFKYCLNSQGDTMDELCRYYYFEAVFSQPTAEYPIPQATATLYFRIEDKQLEERKAPMMWFRVEGDNTDHDVRYVAPCADWLLAVIQKKIKFFQRVESLNMF